jgi:hypothetical protein
VQWTDNFHEILNSDAVSNPLMDGYGRHCSLGSLSSRPIST